jgi:hypothetical protein
VVSDIITTNERPVHTGQIGRSQFAHAGIGHLPLLEANTIFAPRAVSSSLAVRVIRPFAPEGKKKAGPPVSIVKYWAQRADERREQVGDERGTAPPNSLRQILPGEFDGYSVSLRNGYLTSTGFAVPAARFRVLSLNDSSSEGTQYSSLSSVTPLGSCKLKTCGFLTKGAT